ncbi:MAG: hypothetical protein B7X79_10330 [Acidovorax sp. 17-64-282]|nr:MAG: hypothetical protein B7X79_10330 [Acidovorax sp. 17-64-282]
MKSLAPSHDSPVQPLVAAGAPAATPIAFVRAIALAYERRGLSPHRALAQAQIAPQLLQDDSARITAWQMEQISDAAMQELDDEALGWFNRRLPWGSYGMLARASISSPTLQVALARWCRHHGLLADDIALHITTQGETATLAITEARDLGALREFCLVSVLRNAHGLACWLVDSRIPLIAAEFAFDAPPHADAYAVLFRGPVTFHAPRTALHFDARYLNLPLRRDEQALRQMLDDVRRTRAVELLHRTQRPIKQVAEAAGFVNEKSFIRAFRGWTGQSPAEFRRVVRV